MNIGIVTLTFPNRTNEEAAQIIADNDFRLDFMWNYEIKTQISHTCSYSSVKLIQNTGYTMVERMSLISEAMKLDGLSNHTKITILM